MPTGKIVKLVHLSQQTYQSTSQLVSSHNDKGYGTIRCADGEEVYFSHNAVPGRHGFDDLRQGESVEFTLGSDSPFSANFVNATSAPVNGQGATTENGDKNGPRFQHVVRTYQRPVTPPTITHRPLDGYPRAE